MFQILFTSSAFWTALISIIGLLALKYLGIPEDIWAALAIFMGTIVTILFGDSASKSIGLTIARSQRDFTEQLKKEDAYQRFQEPKG